MKIDIKSWLVGALVLAIASIVAPQLAVADIRQEVLIIASLR